jgi:hypothetical protein
MSSTFAGSQHLRKELSGGSVISGCSARVIRINAFLQHALLAGYKALVSRSLTTTKTKTAKIMNWRMTFLIYQPGDAAEGAAAVSCEPSSAM